MNHPVPYEIAAYAHAEVAEAKKRGDLIPQPCRVCGDQDVIAHHFDYSRPLSVIWLCHKHHAAEHAKYDGPLMQSDPGVVGFSLSVELRMQLDAIAASEGRTFSGLVRRILKCHVAEEEDSL